VRLLLDCGRVIPKDVAREIFRTLWVTVAKLVDVRLGPHGYECFRALFYEINMGFPKQPFTFDTRMGTHLGCTLSAQGMKGRRICWFDKDKQQRWTGTIERVRLKAGQPEGGQCIISVVEDEHKATMEIDGPSTQHDMHLVEDSQTTAICFHTKPRPSAALSANFSRAAAGPVNDDRFPDISALVGLNELSHIAVEVFDSEVADLAKIQLLELVDIWEDVPGALHKIMNEHGGVAVGRLRDGTASQRLADLQKDIVSRAIKAVRDRGVLSDCSQCNMKLQSAGDRAPVFLLGFCLSQALRSVFLAIHLLVRSTLFDALCKVKLTLFVCPCCSILLCSVYGAIVSARTCTPSARPVAINLECALRFVVQVAIL